MSQDVPVAEVAPASVTDSVSGTVTVIGAHHPHLRQMVKSIALEVEEQPVNDEFVMGLMEEILSAESVDEIFAAQEKGMISGQDFVMRPFLLKGEDILYKRSRHESFPYYALMKVTEIATGEEVTLNCGGMTFLAVIRALELKGYFADEARPLMLKSTDAPNGAYLSLLPFLGAAKPAAAPRVKK